LQDGRFERIQTNGFVADQRDHRHPVQAAGKPGVVDADMAAPGYIGHVQGQDEGHTHFHKLGEQVQVAGQVGRVGDGHHDIGPLAEDEIAGDDLLGGKCAEAVSAGQVDQGDVMLADAAEALVLLDGFARPVADVLARAGQDVEDRALAAVRVAGQGDGEHPACLAGGGFNGCVGQSHRA